MNQNPFPEAMSPVNMRGPVQSEQKKRYGLMRAAVRAQFPMRHKDGKIRVVEVRSLEDVTRRLEEIRKDKSEKQQPHWTCMHASCRLRKWDSEEALLADHPDQKIMIRQEEAHVYALWCEAAECGTESEQNAWKEREASEAALSLRMQRKDPIIGLAIPE